MNKKEKEQELKRLSKKYFWEQKTNEVSITVLIVLGVVTAFYICSSISLMISPKGVSCPAIGEGYYCTGIFINGFMGLILCSFIIGALFGIGYLVYLWIKANKKKAERRAKDELGIRIEEDYW